MNKMTLGEFALGDVRQWGLYTVFSRAIPSMIDGMKPSQRFFLYSAIMNASKDFKKVSAVGGVGSDYGFQHAETSLMEAGQLMAAEWYNNVNLVQGQGSFGTRLVQSAAAPRYTLVKLHKNFEKYMKDFDLVPEHSDPGHVPPRFYLPVLPLVLLNGSKGIATGFATEILPRSEKDMIDKMKSYIKDGEVFDDVEIQFPKFTGTVSRNDKGKLTCNGKFERTSKTKIIITEVPYGFDRISYVRILDNLHDKGEIVSYLEQCDKEGFRFTVTLKKGISLEWKDDQIMTKFKLSKGISENLTVVGENDDLRVYDNVGEIVRDFCDFHMGILKDRIKLQLKVLNAELKWLTAKMEFVHLVSSGKLIFQGKSKSSMIDEIRDIIDGVTIEDVKRLLTIQIMTLTSEECDKISKEIDVVVAKISHYENTTPQKEFLNDLKEIEKS